MININFPRKRTDSERAPCPSHEIDVAIPLPVRRKVVEGNEESCEKQIEDLNTVQPRNPRKERAHTHT